MPDADLVEYDPKIADLPQEERPRERLLRYGAAALSNAELLAIIIRVGGTGQNVIRLAEALLARHDGLPGLAQAGVEELTELKGVGVAKVAQLKASLELGRRLLASAPDERAQIRSPADAANLLMLEMGMLEQEHLRVILLDTRNRILTINTVYKGSLNSSMVRVGELFREAIRRNAAHINSHSTSFERSCQTDSPYKYRRCGGDPPSRPGRSAPGYRSTGSHYYRLGTIRLAQGERFGL